MSHKSIIETLKMLGRMCFNGHNNIKAINNAEKYTRVFNQKLPQCFAIIDLLRHTGYK